MNNKPKLALVGRPNVGKSALFNRICRQRRSIVDEAEGITRDRLYADADFFGLPFEVIDTGGIDPRSKAPFNEEVKRQAEIAIEEADTLVMVVDAQVGATALDHEVAQVLLKTNKNLCLAVNKIDDLSQMDLIHDFHSLGITNIVPVSASHNWQIAELLEAALTDVQATPSEIDDNSIKVAIVGRPNVGKSSLLNYILNEKRCVVSPIPGTTRDSVDTPFEYLGKQFTLIDTAGIRKKQSEKEVVDKFAAIRTERAIDRSDLCLLLIDAQEGMTTQDKRIATSIEEAGKGCIVILNKWDLVKGVRMEHTLRELADNVHFLKHCPKVVISAKTGRNIDQIFPPIQEVYAAMKHRIQTADLNAYIESVMQLRPPPMIKGKRLRIYYMTQVKMAPPRFLLFINYPGLMLGSYQRYLVNQFRSRFSLPGVPITFQLKGKMLASK